MDIEILGDKWRWETEYKGKRYGDTLSYNKEPYEELEKWARGAWQKCKGIIDKQTL